MADSSLIQVVVPALIGLGGTIVGSAIVLTSQWLLERKKQETEKKNKKAEKLLELAALLHNYRSDDNFVKLEALQIVYFPEFSQVTKKLEDYSVTNTAYSNMPDVLLQKFKEDYPGFGQKEIDEAIEETGMGSLNAYAEYWKKIRDYAKREFQ